MVTTRRQPQEKAARLVKEYAEVGGTSLQGGLRDLLTDLRHLAAREGLDFDFAVQGSGEVFEEEREEPPPDRQAAAEGLEDARQEAVDRAFAEHDFGDLTVEASNGWEHVQGGGEWSRVFFLENLDGGDSIRHTFTVRFKEGPAEIEESCWD